MSTVADDNVRICCKHCGWKKLRLSYRQVDPSPVGPGSVEADASPRVVTLIMRCLKCDRFTPVAG